MADTPTLVRFVSGWKDDGMGEDGLPLYRPTVTVIKERPPFLRVEREATEEDFEENPGPYQLYQKQQAAMSAKPTASGFPLALWAACGPASLKMLSARDIVTVEQLAKRAGAGGDMPAELKELAERAKQMLLLSGELGKFEAVIRQLEAEKAALIEQVNELRTTVKTQDGIINSLKLRVA